MSSERTVSLSFEGMFSQPPRVRTELYGRVADVNALAALMGAAPALVTVVGPGGVGKTRLAIAAVERVADAFGGRVAFVALAEVGRSTDLIEVVAAALNVRAKGSNDLEHGIADVLRHRATLLVLDNAEHVLVAMDFVGRLFAECPLLTVLVTSRRPLGFRDEVLYEVSPLAVDSIDSAAVSLFVARTRATRPDFRLSTGDHASVLELCRRLDGLPLAIELAASRAAVLGPAELCQRLIASVGEGSSAGGLRMLSGGTRDMPERHRALYDTIAWSYGLLLPFERRILSELTVFEGGWTLAAAEVVCSGTASSDELIGGLETLLAHRLVMNDDSPLAASVPAERLGIGSEPADIRFRMLETIRQFATEQLALNTTDRERLELRRRHAAHFAGLASRAQRGLESAEESVWTTRLERDDANLRAAFTLFELVDDAAAGLGMAAALGRHWRNSGRWDTGRALLDSFLERAGTLNIDSSVRADALVWSGRLAVESGVVGEDRKGSGEAIASIEEGLALHREAGNPQGLLRAIEAEIVSVTTDRRPQRATSLCAEGLAISIDAGDRWWQAMLESWMGLHAHIAGDLVEAERACRLCRAIAQADGNDHMAGLGGWVLSSVLMSGLRNDEAEPLLFESLRDNLAARDRRSASFCLLSLSALLLRRGDVVPGYQHLQDGLALAQESSDWVGVCHALIAVTKLANRHGMHDHAARLWGALLPEADALFNVASASRGGLDAAVAKGRAAIGDARFEAHAAIGEALGWQSVTTDAHEVIDRARAQAVGLALPPVLMTNTDAPSVFANPHGLSTREIEVLGLIAGGCTNQQLADQLYISIGTVERHTANIYRKIGVRRRTEAVAYALRAGVTVC